MTQAKYTLGISAYAHESSCAVFRDGVLIAHAEEERFNRKKHTEEFPEASIRFCLQFAGCRLEQVEAIGFFWQPWRELLQGPQVLTQIVPGILRSFGGRSEAVSLQFNRWLRMMGLQREIRARFGHCPKVQYVAHHKAHAASTFYFSPFDESAILCVDGRGENSAVFIGRGRKTEIEVLEEFSLPHSLGALYAAVTKYLGFRPYHDEWKVMGLSAYGSGDLINSFAQLLTISVDGRFYLNKKYFSFGGERGNWLNEVFTQEFGPPRSPDSPILSWHRDLAKALQYWTEQAGSALAKRAIALSGTGNLCLSGGVALNCLMNHKILNLPEVERMFVQPVANDAGTSIGAAAAILAKKRLRPTWQGNVYLGPEFTQGECEQALRQRSLPIVTPSKLECELASLLQKGQIVGSFQGRMESGPRALGNRSILANAMLTETKDRLNLRVKKREDFRPFAPVVLAEFAQEYFELSHKTSFGHMIFTAQVRPKAITLLPATTHIDGTARVQTVRREDNEFLWRVLWEFYQLTKVPVLVNTSFNENEPLVCTPLQAVDCFLRTDLDALAIGQCLVKRNI